MSKTRKVELPVLRMRASIEAGSASVEKRTARVIWSSGAPVLRWHPDIGYFWEKLRMTPEACRMDRMNKGACNVLDSHLQRDMSCVVGKVLNGSIENGLGYSDIRFSRKARAEEIFQDVLDGIGDTNSIGYMVYRYELLEQPAEGYPTYEAVVWEILEVSFVPVGADSDARTEARSQPTDQIKNECEFIENSNEKETDMTPEQIEAQRKADAVAAQKAANEAADKAAAEAVAAEEKRCVEIQSISKRAGLDSDFALRMISEKKTLDEVRDIVIDEQAKRQAPPSKTQIEPGNPVGLDAAKRGIENALLVRSGALPEKELSQEGRDFRGDSLLRMFEELERSKGRSVRGLSRTVMSSRALHSDSDLPEILSNIANKHLINGYQSIPQELRPLVTERPLADFKEVAALDLAMLGDLVKKAPGEPYKHTTLVEGKDKYKAETYGRSIGFTREMIMNDDLRALTDIPLMFGQAGARTENKLFFSIFTGNQVMGDGKTLFHADHANQGSNTGVNNDALTKLMGFIETQKDLAGEFIAVQGKYILAPIEYKKTIEALLAAIYATKASDVNVHAGKYTPIFAPYLAAGSIFGAAEKSQINSIEAGYVDGNRAVYIEEKIDFETDGINIKARLDVVIRAINHRGLSKLTIS